MKKISQKKQAAALKYDPAGDDAPVVTAVGQGTVAEKIIETAEKNKVPVMENAELSQVLQSLSVGDVIPPKLYEAVAQIFVFIFQMDKNYKR